MNSPPRANKVLVVDDEPNILSSIRTMLELEGYDVSTAGTANEALPHISAVDLLLTDLNLPGMHGLTLLENVREHRPDLPVAIMTAHGTVDTAVAAMKSGAFAYLLKPCTREELLLKVALGLKLSGYERELQKRNTDLERIRVALSDANHQLESSNAALQDANRELQRLATTDPLTGLYNRRKLMERLREETLESARYNKPLSLLMIDIDHFKRINDKFGHPVGDTVLVHVAGLLQQRARDADIVARVGGEEFAVLTPETFLEGARELAEAIRSLIEEETINDVGPVTVSIGVAKYDPTNPDEGLQLIKNADSGLYQAKHEGRNRVVTIE